MQRAPTQLATLILGFIGGLLLSAAALTMIPEAEDTVAQDDCFVNGANFKVTVVDVTADTITYAGVYNGRMHVWTRGAKHFRSYYERCANDGSR